VGLGEAEELDTITPCRILVAPWIHACGALALPRRLGALTPGLRPFYDPRCAPASTRNTPALLSRQGGPGSRDPAEKGTRSARWRQAHSLQRVPIGHERFDLGELQAPETAREKNDTHSDNEVAHGLSMPLAAQKAQTS